METAVAWGRYAELFDYDAGRRRFVLPDAPEEEIATDVPDEDNSGDTRGSEDGK
jgi:NitT/TauT family transport system ATP-binding protein